jgi:membrane protein required for colicin V production
VNFLITHLVEKTGLSGTDRLLGVGFGFARGVLLVAIVLLAARMTSFPQSVFWQQSRLVPALTPIETWLAKYIPKNIQQDVIQSKAQFDNAHNNSTYNATKNTVSGNKDSETATMKKATSDSQMMRQ